MSGEVERVAREMLAAEFDAAGKARSAADVRRGPKPGHCTPLHMQEALRAIAKALSRTPSDAARKAVVEECARVAEGLGKMWDSGREEHEADRWAEGASDGADRISAAIRALASTPAGEE